MYLYRVYGLNISSELECPSLLPSDREADITIRFGIISSQFVAKIPHKAVNVISKTQVFADFKGIAKYLISDGKDVLVEPYWGGEEMVRLFLLGSVMGIIMHQRGLLPLHGCGIVHNEKAILFLGVTGIGKSTLAEAFRRKGYELLTDDVAALSFHKGNEVVVSPGYPMIKLMDDAVKYFKISTKGLAGAHPKKLKYVIPAQKDFCTSPKPLGKIYILERTEEKILTIENPRKIVTVPLLKHNTYRKVVIKRLGLLQRQLEQCVRLADNYPVKVVYRPDNASAIPQLIDALEKDFQ